MKYVKYPFFLLIILFVLIIQSSIFIYNISLNLTVLIAYYAGIKNKGLSGLFIGAMTGFLEDVFSSSFIGINMLSKSLIGYVSVFIYGKYFIWTPLLGLLVVILFTFVDGFLIYILKSIFDRVPIELLRAFFVISIQSLFNAIFGYFIKPVIKR